MDIHFLKRGRRYILYSVSCGTDDMTAEVRDLHQSEERGNSIENGFLKFGFCLHVVFSFVFPRVDLAAACSVASLVSYTRALHIRLLLIHKPLFTARKL